MPSKRSSKFHGTDTPSFSYGDIRRNGVGTSTLVGEGVRPVASFDEAESPAFMHGEYVKLIRLGGRTVLAGAAAWWEQLDT